MACDAREAIPDNLVIPFHLNLCASMNKKNEFLYYREILSTEKGRTNTFGIQRQVEGASDNQKLVRGQEMDLFCDDSHC